MIPHPVKSVIVARGLTQRQVARDVGVNEHTFSRVINGRVAPWPALRRRLADRLGVSESELFFDNQPAGAA